MSHSNSKSFHSRLLKSKSGFNFLIALLAYSFLAVPSQSMTCDAFVNVRRAAENQVGTPRRTEVNRDSLKQATSLAAQKNRAVSRLDEALARSLTQNMIKSGLLHSPFFETAVRDAVHEMLGSQPENIILYMKSLHTYQLNALANAVYLRMEAMRIGASIGENMTGVRDQNQVIEILTKGSPREVIDKIGDAILHTIRAENFINLENAVEAQKNGWGKWILPGSSAITVSLLAKLMGTFGDIPLLYSMAESIFMLAGIPVAATHFPRTRRGRAENRQTKKLTRGSESERGLRKFEFFVRPDSGQLDVKLRRIEEALENSVKIRSLELDPALQIGSLSGKLRQEITEIFINEFQAWMTAAQSQALRVDSTPGDKSQAVLDARRLDLIFLENLLKEAGEVVRDMTELSQKLEEIIESDIQKLEARRGTMGGKTQEAALDGYIVLMRKRKLGQTQFTATLDQRVRQTLIDSMLAISSVRDATSNIATGQVLEQTQSPAIALEMAKLGDVYDLVEGQFVEVTAGN